MNARIHRESTGGAALHERRPREGFGDQTRIVLERGEELAQDLRRARGRSHALQLRLQLRAGNRASPHPVERLGQPQGPLDASAADVDGEHVSEFRLRSAVGLGPYPVAPIDLIDRALRGDSVVEGQLRDEAAAAPTQPKPRTIAAKPILTPAISPPPDSERSRNYTARIERCGWDASAATVANRECPV